MNPIKVMWQGKHLRDIYPHATKWQVFKYHVRMFIRKVVISTAIVLGIITVYGVGGLTNPVYYSVQAENVAEVIKAIPIMERIAKCESPNGHYDKNGQVVLRANNNKTVDVGQYQINSVWFAKATELGLDITKEADNEAMAMWIYQNRGTGDWYSSAKCWQK